MKTRVLNILLVALGMALASGSAQAQFQKKSDLAVEQVALLENGNWLGTGYAGVYLSADQGVTWTKTAFPSQGRPGLGIATRSVVGGGLTFVGAMDDGIWLSRDHGTNWTFTGPVARSFGTGIGRMAYNGTDYVAGYGGWPRGLYRWNGTGWDNTLAGTDGLSVLAAGNGRFLAGMLGGGVVSSDDGGRTWRNRHPEFQLLARTANSVLGVGTPSGVVRRSDDNGDTWREEGSAVPAASMGYVDQPAVYGGALYVPVHGSGIWLRRPDLTWTRVLTNSGFCSVHVVGPSLVVASKEGVFQLTDESAFARILAQPQSLTANLGDTATIAVVATNATTFQWFKDGTPLPGATNATLTLANVQPPRIGDYQVVAGNGFGSVTSSVATLSINGVNPGTLKGLVAYYPFNGDARDLSGMANDGLAFNAAYGPDRRGVGGQALFLTNRIVGVVPWGDVAHVRLPADLINGVGAEGSIALWVYPLNGVGGFVGKCAPTVSSSPVFAYGGYSMTTGWSTAGDPGRVYFRPNNWSPLLASKALLATSTWNHVVLTYSASGARLYIDGKLDTALSGNFSIASTDAPSVFNTLGVYLWDNDGSRGNPNLYSNGMLDDFRLYKRALSDAEVAAMFAEDTALEITKHPQAVMANLGDTATFAVVASSATTFQWFKDGTPLPGATNATLTLANVQPPRIGDYQVVAGNGFGSVTSSVATLSINGVNPGIWKGLVGYYPLDGVAVDILGINPTGILTNVAPVADRFGNMGKALGFQGAPNSRVRFDSGVLPRGSNAFTASLWAQTLLRRGQTGEYLGVGNGLSETYTSFFALWDWSVRPALQFFSTNQFHGGFSAYQINPGRDSFDGWQHLVWVFDPRKAASLYVDGKRLMGWGDPGWVDIDNWTKAVLGPGSVKLGEGLHGNLDDLKVFNRLLSDSEVAALYASELPPPAAIVVPPASVTALVGGTAALSVGATNALGYQWFKDGVALDGATSTNLVLPNLRLSDAGSYWVIATNVMSRATSAPAVVVVHMPPAIVAQPLDTTVDPGGSVTLAASVASFPASVLQWFREGVPVPGATNATLVLGPVQAAGMGSYQLVASNVVGTTSSRVARVSVTGADPAIWGGLVAYLPFNGGVADEGFWSHPVVQQGASLATDRRGKANGALALNGAGDFVEIPDHPALATTNFTVALWFNPVRRAGASGGVDAEALFSKGPGSMDLQLGTPPSGTGGIRFRPRGEAAWDTTGPAFGTNRWQHVVAVYDASGGAVQVFVDGVARPMASTGVVVPSLTTTTNGLRLGLRHDGSGGFLGRLDDVRVYARALGASEVRALLASEAAAPVIVDQPQDVRRVEGSRVTVSAGLVGERPMAFAWSQAGATRVVTTESLEFASLGRQDAGLYKLVVTNVHGTATSRAFTVDVLFGPELVFEPTDKSVNAGATVRLSAGVDGNPTPTLQWTRDGRALPGATNSTLTIAGIQAGDVGLYRLVASNEVGTVTGREVRVSVFYAPVITRQPRALTVDHGKGFEVSVEASGIPVPTFQWTRGGVALPGATNAAVQMASATVADEGEYRVEVRNELGTIQSEPALVTVRRVGPVIGGLPATLEVAEGDDMALAAAVEAIPSATLQWLHEGEPLPGETNATLKIARVRVVEAGRYALAATNVAGGTVREVVVGVKASGQSLGLALDTGLDVAWPWPTATGWHYQTRTSHDGEDAARSAKIGGYQSSEMRLPLRGPGSLTFWWRTSCEEGWDYAEVLLDGQRKGRLTGERNWAAVRVDVPEGVHTVTWRYAKDGSTDEGEDAAWVDEVTWIPETAGVQPAWVEVVPTLEGGYQVRSMGGGAGRAVIQSSEDMETWRDVVVGTGTGGVLRARVEGMEGARFFRARTGNGN